MDELTLTLPRKIRDEARAAAGDAYVPHPAEAVLDRMVEEFDRKGRSSGAGFYEYENGRRTRLWPGLRSELGATNHDVDLHELAERMLVVEAVETQRCLDEGVLTSVADANVGSVLGIGYPPWTGGVVQYVEGFPGGVAGVRGSGGRPRGPVRRAVPGSRLAARPSRRLIRPMPAASAVTGVVVREGGGSPDESGTLERWRTGCSRSWTGWARSVSVC